MAEYTFGYRGNEIEAVVEAEDEEEAYAKLQDGDTESCEVQFWALWPEFWELTETTEATQ